MSASTGHELSKLEQEMLEKGYASARMVAVKINRHFATVSRLVKDNKLRSVAVGSQKFIEISSVIEYIGVQGSALLDLGNWSNIDLAG